MVLVPPESTGRAPPTRTPRIVIFCVAVPLLAMTTPPV